ncbi:hypothetical protein J2Z50_006557 [Ensifer mexicanus]|nr:hypothetical protein [Sinorhizobium mexicanum]
MADFARPTVGPASRISECDRAFFGSQKARHDTRQSRFPRAVTAGQNQGLASRQAEGNINENQIVTTSGSEIFSGEVHQIILSLLRSRGASKSLFLTLCVQIFTKLSTRSATTPAVGVNLIFAPNMELHYSGYPALRMRLPFAPAGIVSTVVAGRREKKGERKTAALSFDVNNKVFIARASTKIKSIYLGSEDGSFDSDQAIERSLEFAVCHRDRRGRARTHHPDLHIVRSSVPKEMRLARDRREPMQLA